MKNISRVFLALALLVSLGLTACEKSEPPPVPSDQPTNAAPAPAPEHPEHPQ